MPTEKRADRLSRALVGNMSRAKVKRGVDGLHGEVMEAADADGTVVELSGICFHILDEFLHGLDRHVHVHSQKERCTCEHRDGNDILGIVRKLFVEQWIDG